MVNILRGCPRGSNTCFPLSRILFKSVLEGREMGIVSLLLDLVDDALHLELLVGALDRIQILIHFLTA